MSLILIAAVDRNFAIGRGNKLLYSVPEDMARFKALTTGHTVLMGRKTLQSFPGGRPLKNRKNIVVSSNYVNIEEYGNLYVARSLPDALAMTDGREDTFVIGGQSIYHALCPLCDKAYITKIDAETADADAFFPNLDENPAWTLTDESAPFISSSGITYRFCEYRKK